MVGHGIESRDTHVMNTEDHLTNMDLERSPNMSSNTNSIYSNRSKYESMDLSGSVYLVSGDGKIISLPMPSRSPRDPLNWSRKKRVLAFLPVLWYQIVCLVLVQGTSSLYLGVLQEFTPAVCGIFLNQYSNEKNTRSDRNSGYAPLRTRSSGICYFTIPRDWDLFMGSSLFGNREETHFRTCHSSVDSKYALGCNHHQLPPIFARIMLWCYCTRIRSQRSQ